MHGLLCQCARWGKLKERTAGHTEAKTWRGHPQLIPVPRTICSLKCARQFRSRTEGEKPIMATSPAVAVSQFPGRNHDARRHKPLARLRTCGQSFGGPWTQYANPEEGLQIKRAPPTHPSALAVPSYHRI